MKDSRNEPLKGQDKTQPTSGQGFPLFESSEKNGISREPQTEHGDFVSSTLITLLLISLALTLFFLWDVFLNVRA